MGENFAPPASQLGTPSVGPLQVAAYPTAGQGLALDSNGKLPVAVRKLLPGYEFAYAEQASDVSITATTAATANTVVTAPAVVFDGKTTVYVEFFCGAVDPASAAGAAVVINLWDGSTDLGFFGQIFDPAASLLTAPVLLKRKITPTSGSHTYAAKAWETGGTATLKAGAGGIGVWNPIFIRVIAA